jgi:hypothetical protein
MSWVDKELKRRAASSSGPPRVRHRTNVCFGPLAGAVGHARARQRGVAERTSALVDAGNSVVSATEHATSSLRGCERTTAPRWASRPTASVICGRVGLALEQQLLDSLGHRRGALSAQPKGRQSAPVTIASYTFDDRQTDYMIKAHGLVTVRGGGHSEKENVGGLPKGGGGGWGLGDVPHPLVWLCGGVGKECVCGGPRGVCREENGPGSERAARTA